VRARHRRWAGVGAASVIANGRDAGSGEYLRGFGHKALAQEAGIAAYQHA